MKRIAAFLLAIVLFFSVFSSINSTAFSCNEEQSDTYVLQILFGDRALAKSSNTKVKMLLAALYLCSEQSNGAGKDKLTFLKQQKVSDVPAFTSIDIKEQYLLECSHNTWAYECEGIKKNQTNRKKLLLHTVKKVFNFGFLNNLLGSKSGKCNSFAALLYYSHILSDYLALDLTTTEAMCGDVLIPAYSGESYYTLNNNIPRFTEEQFSNNDPLPQLSDLDRLGRSGSAFAILSKESMEFIGPHPNNLPNPTGWKQANYPDMITGEHLFDRSHLIGHQFCGIDNKYNLMIGTNYLNQTSMKRFEDAVSNYLKDNPNNHVLYRVTPVYKGENLIPSGVQMEAYSIEDSGVGICFNVYCYNVQPGIEINYATGDSFRADAISGQDGVIPFASFGAGKENPDLIYEINTHLEKLFEDQKNSLTYASMMNQIQSIAENARKAALNNDPTKLKESQYQYYNVLRTYIPSLLAKEQFFKSAF